MVLSSALKFDIASASICITLIFTRFAYRFLFRCKVHKTCHRRWRVDDAFIAFALIPLLGRTCSIVSSFILDPLQSYAPPTEAEAASLGRTLEAYTQDRITSRQLIIPARICYALFLWSLKLCLLSFYSRLMDAMDWGKTVVRLLRVFIVLTFIAVVIASLLECRPLSLMWHLVPAAERDKCTRGLANLMTMAIFNILTDLALIILPFPILKFIRLNRRAKIQLSLLFATGFIVVTITILRIPLILIASVSQRSRSMWASIEIVCACIVANTAFFLAVVKDMQGQHKMPSNSSSSENPAQPSIYLQNLPSSSLRGLSSIERVQTSNSKRQMSQVSPNDVHEAEHAHPTMDFGRSFV